MDTFLLYCLLEESPPCDDDEQDAQAANLEAIVNRGRAPGLELKKRSASCPMEQWARELLGAMTTVAGTLDTAHQSDHYAASLAAQLAKVTDPELTPSARVLREMRTADLPFFRLAMTYSEQWARYFRERPLAPATLATFEAQTSRSLQAQRDMEQGDAVDFATYLRNFYDQYRTL